MATVFNRALIKPHGCPLGGAARRGGDSLLPRLAPWRRWLTSAVLAMGVALPVAALDLATLDYGLRPRELAPGVWVVEGANADFERANGCNIINTGFIVSSAGVLVINTGPSRLYGEQLRAAIGRVTPAPITQVLQLNLHPDYFLGNQAFADVPRRATALTRDGVAREHRAYEDNLFRLCGDWMKGTETLAPNSPAVLGRFSLGERELELREYRGHTASDLVLIDHRSGVVFAGGLAFSDRAPTTPHADLALWRKTLQQLSTDLASAITRPLAALVPSHGPVRADQSALAQTDDYLAWLHATLADSAARGLELNELLRLPVPPRIRAMAGFDNEFIRQVSQLYPRYEARALTAAPQ